MKKSQQESKILKGKSLKELKTSMVGTKKKKFVSEIRSKHCRSFPAINYCAFLSLGPADHGSPF